MGIFSETNIDDSIILSPIWFYSSSLLETLIIAMVSYFRSAGDKIVETFQGKSHLFLLFLSPRNFQ